MDATKLTFAEIAALLIERQLKMHIQETEGLIANNDAKSAAEHAYDECHLKTAIDALRKYNQNRDEG